MIPNPAPKPFSNFKLDGLRKFEGSSPPTIFSFAGLVLQLFGIPLRSYGKFSILWKIGDLKKAEGGCLLIKGGPKGRLSFHLEQGAVARMQADLSTSIRLQSHRRV